MIKKLIINNFAIIDNITVEFDERFNIITGETGAGKSLIINAIDILIGGRLNEKMLRDKSRELNILEIAQPELNAYLVAKNIADQLGRRVSHRRALRQAVQRAMQAGAKGIKIIVKGRINGSEIARSDKIMEGRVPLHTIGADIDYDYAEAATTFGRIGVKVWIYKGNVEPEPIPERVEEMETIELTVTQGEGEVELEFVESDNASA